MRIRFAALFVFQILAVLAVAPAARAESTWVVLVRPTTRGANVEEILNRVRGELLADGFSVVVADPVAEADRLDLLARTGRATDAPLVAGLFVEDGATTIRVCIVNELSGRVLWRRLDLPPDERAPAAEILARRTVELLRASLLDFLVESLRVAASEGRRPQTVQPEAPKEQEHRWAIEAGLGVLGTLGGMGPAVLPLARVHYAASPTFHVRATGAWLGTQPRLEVAGGGSATVEQGIALLEATAQIWPGRWARPVFSLGAGIYYVGVNGSGSGAFEGQRSAQVAFALDAGTGLATRIGPHLEVVLEGHAVVTAPGVGIRFANVEAAHIGRPSFLATLTLAGWI